MPPASAPRPWVALVGPEIEENLSLRYIASSLRAAGFEPRILPFHTDTHYASVLDAVLRAPTPPLMVGLSLAFQWRATDFLAVAMALRTEGYRGHITVGGHFATFAASELMRDFAELDSVCRQEAEEVVCNLARALAANTPLEGIAGLTHRRADGTVAHEAPAAVPDLATLPWPDRSGTPADVYGHRIAPLVGSRGCYANCTFCCIAAWHEQSQPGRRYRIRTPDDVADEMASLHRERGVDLFVFHDDNFFLPKHADNLERFTALADALEARGVRDFATIVKARPTDVRRDVFTLLQRRLRCVRAYVGIETDSEQGLITLGRWAKPRHNHEAIAILRELRLFTCFNVLMFDPDTTFESLEENLSFMESAADFPFNFGRAELYAGTPLLTRMVSERRVRGDYLKWDYTLANKDIDRVFRIAGRAFDGRNFAGNALANSMMGTRFEVEACRHFHPQAYRPEWFDRGVSLSRRLGEHSVATLRAIVAHVKHEPASSDGAAIAAWATEVSSFDAVLRREAIDLAREIHAAIGIGSPLTFLDDVTATPLQNTDRVVTP